MWTGGQKLYRHNIVWDATSFSFICEVATPFTRDTFRKYIEDKHANVLYTTGRVTINTSTKQCCVFVSINLKINDEITVSYSDNGSLKEYSFTSSIVNDRVWEL